MKNTMIDRSEDASYDPEPEPEPMTSTVIQEFRKKFFRYTEEYGGYSKEADYPRIQGEIATGEEIEQFILSSMRSLLDRVEKEVDDLVVSALFNNDMRWTRIHEMIKMRAPISPDDAEYYRKPFKDMQAKLTSLKAEVEEGK